MLHEIGELEGKSPEAIMEEIVTMNTAKLRKRYPVDEGYSDDRANTRNTTEERKALEAAEGVVKDGTITEEQLWGEPSGEK